MLQAGKVIDREKEYSFYAASLAAEEHSAEELNQIIRGHWSACENGSHYRRDVSMGEDASQVRGRNRAEVMAVFKNLTLGLFELAKDRGQTKADYLPEFCRQMTGSMALKVLKQRG